MTQNPFTQINDRLDQIERQITSFKSDLSQRVESNPQERLTRKEVQLQYKVSLSTIHKLMLTGDLLYSKIGRKTLFKREDVELCFGTTKADNSNKKTRR